MTMILLQEEVCRIFYNIKFFIKSYSSFTQVNSSGHFAYKNADKIIEK